MTAQQRAAQRHCGVLRPTPTLRARRPIQKGTGPTPLRCLGEPSWLPAPSSQFCLLDANIHLMAIGSLPDSAKQQAQNATKTAGLELVILGVES